MASPTISISSNKSPVLAGETATITFALSESSTDFTSGDVSVTNGSLSSFSGTGTNYTATFTPLANSNLFATISVAAGVFHNATNESNVAASYSLSVNTVVSTPTNVNVTIADTIPPTLSITSNKDIVAIGQTATLTFNLSEVATDFTSSDITVTGGTISNFAGSGSSYTATFTPTANSTTNGVISVAVGTFSDPSGNKNATGATYTIPIDTTVPTISIGANPTVLTAGQKSLITFTLNKASTDFTLSDVTVTTGSLSEFQGTGTNYGAIFTPVAGANSSSTISVPSGAFHDANSVANVLGASVTITSGTIVPTISITSNPSTLIAGQTSVITFTLSASSTNFTADDVSVTNGVISNFTGSGTSYTANFSPFPNINASGTVSVTASSFTDATGNSNTAGASTTLTINTIIPTLTIVSDKSILGISQSATITFTLSESSTNFTSSDVSVTGGTISNFAGSGRSYTATFTPTSNTSTIAEVKVDPAKFTNAAGNSNSVGASVKINVNNAISGVTVPTISITSDTASLTAGQFATITFILSQPSNNFIATDITYSGGILSNFTGRDSVYTAIFTPTNNSTAPGVISVSSNKFSNSSNVFNTTGATANILINTTNIIPPRIAITTNKTSLSVGETANITFSLSAASKDFVDSDITVSGGTLSPLVGSIDYFTAVFTPLPNSTTNGVISVASNKFSDSLGNFNVDGADTNNTVTIAVNTVIRPSAQISSSRIDFISGTTSTVTFSLSSTSTNFIASDVVVSGGTLTNFAGSGKTYTATFTPNPTSKINGVITVPAGSFTDLNTVTNIASTLTVSINTLIADVVTPNRYNDIQTKINTVLKTNYGYTSIRSVPTTSGTIVTAKQWNDLYYDLNRCIVHQTGEQLKVTGFPATSGFILTADAVNTLVDNANQIVTNSTSVADNQLIRNSTNGISTLTSTWGNNRSHQVKHTWPSSAYATYFFNLGGKIAVRLSYPDIVYTGEDLIWKNLIDDINAALDARVYGPQDFSIGSPVSITRSSGSESITVNFSKMSTTQTLTTVTLTKNFSAAAANIDITSTVEFRYSTELPASSPAGGGVACIGLPQTEKVIGLDNSVGGGVLIQTKILQVTPNPITISMPSGTSNSATVTLTNRGNTSMSITGIDASIPAGSGLVSTITSKSWSTPTLTLAANATATFNVVYSTSPKQGNFNAVLTVVGDNDTGYTTTPINLTVTEPLFDFNFSPANINITANTPSITTRYVTIVANGSYSASFTDPVFTQDSHNFFTMTFNRPSMSILLSFNPQAYKINGTYTATVTLTLTGNLGTRPITKTLTFTAVRVLNDQSRHLGHWMSPQAEYNSVVGMSYDIIEGTRYLTVGFGLQGDPTSKTLLKDNPTLLTTNTLGVDADEKTFVGNTFNGPVIYPVIQNSSYSNFYNQYGGWIRPNTTEPKGINLTRGYKFTTTVAGVYTWEISAAGLGSFTINNDRAMSASSNSPTTSTKGTKILAAGTHTVVFQITGVPTFTSSGIAIRIMDPSGVEVWSTKNAIRSNSFANWAEVYRVPILSATSGNVSVMQSSYYCIKDTAANRSTGDGEDPLATRWGFWFGERYTASLGSLFTVRDDGYGNLSIVINAKSGLTGTVKNKDLDVTARNFPYSSWYYSARGTRYSQLESGPINSNGVAEPLNLNSTYTHKFTGFDSAGTVTTTIVAYPKTGEELIYQETYTGSTRSGNTLTASIDSSSDWKDTAVTYAVTALEVAAAVVATDIVVATAVTAVVGAGYALADYGIVSGILYVFSTGFFCFKDTTKVKMSDGSIKNIEDVQVGDLVANHDGTSFNCVKFIVDADYKGKLYTPTNDVEPFGSKEHPLILDNKYYSYDVDYANANMPWLGEVQKLEYTNSVDVTGIKVYNLLVDGDGTYNVNGFGTTSIIGDGGKLIKDVEQGLITKEQALETLRHYHDAGGTTLHNWYLANKL